MAQIFFAHKKWIVLFLIALLFAGGILRYSHRAPKRQYSDFRVYYAAAGHFLKGEPIYWGNDPKITPYKYSPMFAFMISPLGWFSIHRSSLIFFATNFICLLGIFALSYRLLNPEIKGKFKKILLIVVPFLVSLRFIMSVLDAGQANILMIFFLLAGLYASRKNEDVLAAIFIALSIMVKYVTFIFVPYFLIRRKFKLTFLIFCMTAVYMILPAIGCGIDKNAEYHRSWIPSITQTSLDKGSWTDYKNQSFYSAIIRFFMKDSPYKNTSPSLGLLSFEAATILSVILSILLYFFMIRPWMRESKTELLDYGLLFIGLAIFNPNAWPFNYIAVIFPCMYVVYELAQCLRSLKNVLFLFIVSCGLFILSSESIIGQRLEYILEVNSYLFLATLVLVACLFMIRYRNADPHFKIHFWL
jgi:hypothetical protein